MSSTQGLQKNSFYSYAMYPIVYSFYIHTNTYIKFNRHNNKYWILPSEKYLRFFFGVIIFLDIEESSGNTKEVIHPEEGRGGLYILVKV